MVFLRKSKYTVGFSLFIHELTNASLPNNQIYNIYPVHRIPIGSMALRRGEVLRFFFEEKLWRYGLRSTQRIMAAWSAKTG